MNIFAYFYTENLQIDRPYPILPYCRYCIHLETLPRYPIATHDISITLTDLYVAATPCTLRMLHAQGPRCPNTFLYN